MKKFIYLFLVISLSLYIIEKGLKYSGKLNTYPEKNFGKYQSPYDSNNAKQLYTWGKNESFKSVQTEFEYTYTTNQFGFAEQHKLDTCSTQNTIIFIGDSFVFGVGAAQDSSAPRFLEKQLNLPIFNAGIPGSDPFYEKVLIDSIFKPIGYDRYIIMVNFSDIYDYVIRGGMERFGVNNTISYREAPCVEDLYERSHLVRALVHQLLGFDYSLLSQKKTKALKEEAIREYSALFLAISKEVNCLVVIQPYARQYTNNYSVLTEVLNYSYLEKLDSSLRVNNVKTINLDPLFAAQIGPENYLKYSWELDGHYNADGYELLSQLLAKELKEKYPNFIYKAEKP